MLRAIGTSRTQVRRIVRFEAVITSLIGAVLGIALGTAFGYVVVSDLSSQGIFFAFPFGQTRRVPGARRVGRCRGGDHPGAARGAAQHPRGGPL